MRIYPCGMAGFLDRLRARATDHVGRAVAGMLEKPIRDSVGGRFRRAMVGIVGGSMALAGVALLVLPGPGIPLILAGLGILSLEFAIAGTWMEAIKRRSEGAGVPKQAFWVLPAAGILLSVGVTVATGFFAVVHEHRAWTVVRKPSFGWSHSYASVEELRAASAEHPDAAELLRRSGLEHPH